MGNSLVVLVHLLADSLVVLLQLADASVQTVSLRLQILYFVEALEVKHSEILLYIIVLFLILEFRFFILQVNIKLVNLAPQLIDFALRLSQLILQLLIILNESPLLRINALHFALVFLHLLLK